VEQPIQIQNQTQISHIQVPVPTCRSDIVKSWLSIKPAAEKVCWQGKLATWHGDTNIVLLFRLGQLQNASCGIIYIK
jgi:hypothetical protein